MGDPRTHRDVAEAVQGCRMIRPSGQLLQADRADRGGQDEGVHGVVAIVGSADDFAGCRYAAGGEGSWAGHLPEQNDITRIVNGASENQASGGGFEKRGKPSQAIIGQHGNNMRGS